MGKWYSGKFKPKNRQKLINVSDPIYRSSWELRAFNYCDNNKNVIRWASELVVIPYYFEYDNKMHKYYTDLYMEVLDNTGTTKKFIVEIKPSDQCTVPKPPKRKTAKSMKNYHNKVIDVNRNHAKWKATRQFCEKKGYEFKIITEKQLF